MTRVAILTVRRSRLDAFRMFERHAAVVMAAHGGRIERTVVVPVADAPELVREIHVVTFPDARAFEAYRDDARLADAGAPAGVRGREHRGVRRGGRAGLWRRRLTRPR